MPTKLDRVQVLFQKDIFNKLKRIAKIERRSLSSMVGSIVQDAIESQKYQSVLSKAKANELKSKVDEGLLLIKDILKPKIPNEIDSNIKLKLKKIESIFSLISETNQDEIDQPMNDDSLGEEVFKPSLELDEIDFDAGTKLNKLRSLLSKVNKIDTNL